MYVSIVQKYCVGNSILSTKFDDFIYQGIFDTKLIKTKKRTCTTLYSVTSCKISLIFFNKYVT